MNVRAALASTKVQKIIRASSLVPQRGRDSRRSIATLWWMPGTVHSRKSIYGHAHLSDRVIEHARFSVTMFNWNLCRNKSVARLCMSDNAWYLSTWNFSKPTKPRPSAHSGSRKVVSGERLRFHDRNPSWPVPRLQNALFLGRFLLRVVIISNIKTCDDCEHAFFSKLFQIIWKANAKWKRRAIRVKQFADSLSRNRMADVFDY